MENDISTNDILKLLIIVARFVLRDSLQSRVSRNNRILTHRRPSREDAPFETPRNLEKLFYIPLSTIMHDFFIRRITPFQLKIFLLIAFNYHYSQSNYILS